ncbi:helix-turn-helix domain-containing protein [Paenibacillus whitsoniae]|nr:AraC family transcriptional regulator [Paenibacillus whitsoniae]
MNKNLVPLNPEETLPYLNLVSFPPYITLAHLFHAPEGWRTPTRSFPQYALQYVVKGTAIYQIEDKTYTTKQGDLLMHQPNELNAIHTISGEPYICISLVFHFGGQAMPFQSWTRGHHEFGNYLNHPLEAMLTQLVSNYKHLEPERQLKSQGLLLQILAELTIPLRYRAHDSSPHANMNKMILVKNYMIEHFQKPMNYERLEGISGLSKNYLISQFKACFGMPPSQYQLRVRIQRAKELALQSGLSVSEIAQEVGYSDVHTFGKMFKKKTGISLSEYVSTLTI